MNAQEITDNLRLLGAELEQRGVTGEIVLVGGAVMLLVIGNRQTTKDIDAYFASNAQEIRATSDETLRGGFMQSNARDTNEISANHDLHWQSDPQSQEIASDAGGQRYNWRRQTIKETFERIVSDPSHPWLAIGDFLDDWRFTDVGDRLDLVSEGIAASDQGNLELQRWAAFCAAMVEWLCRQDQLSFPAWTSNAGFYLSEPWFLYPGDLLRAWQLVSTPAPFKMRNIFGGDQMLSRA